jgi:uncharacterized membrane protein (UPF0127 family)
MRVVLVLVALVSCSSDDSVYAIENSDRAVVLSVVYDVAATASARSHGLRGRSELSKSQGLLLQWPEEVEACITNSGVAFPIDVVFLDESECVVGIESFGSGDGAVICYQAVASVLEVSLGVAVAVMAGDCRVAP